MAHPRSGLERSSSDIAVERFFACCCHIITNSFALFVCFFGSLLLFLLLSNHLSPYVRCRRSPLCVLLLARPPFVFVLASKIASTLLLLALFPRALSQRCPPYLAVKSLFVLPIPSPSIDRSSSSSYFDHSYYPPCLASRTCFPSISILYPFLFVYSIVLHLASSSLLPCLPRWPLS